MARKERDTSKKRKELIDAAVSTFEEVGYEASTMEQIAINAGAAKKTLYNHFQTKENLLEIIVEQCISAREETAAIRYFPEFSLEEQLKEIIEVKTRNYNNPEKLKSMRVLFNTYTRHKELINSMYSGIHNDEYLLINWLTDAEKDNKLKIKDKELASYLFWSMVNGSIIWPLLLNDGFCSERINLIAKEIVDIFLCRYKI